MSSLAKTVAGVSSALLIQYASIANAQNYNFYETQSFVAQTCPIQWETLISSINLVPGADVWENNLGDKARYINFSSVGVTPSDSDGGSRLQITRYSDQDSIPACGLMRTHFFAAARLDSQIAAGFDHTLIRDDDGDGVFNLQDVCWDTTTGESVDADGCSAAQLASDEDGDGVHDYIDECPGTATGETTDDNGCSSYQLDADNDGIPNDQDAYPLQHNSMCPAN